MTPRPTDSRAVLLGSDNRNDRAAIAAKFDRGDVDILVFARIIKRGDQLLGCRAVRCDPTDEDATILWIGRAGDDPGAGSSTTAVS